MFLKYDKIEFKYILFKINVKVKIIQSINPNEIIQTYWEENMSKCFKFSALQL